MSRVLVHFFLTLALFGSVLIATPIAVRAQDATPPAAETEAIIQRFVAAMNEVFATGNADVMDDVVSPEYVDNTPSLTRTGSTRTLDLAGLKPSFEAVHAVFPEAKVTVDETIVEGDMAAVLVTFDGLHGPGTLVDGVIIFRVADGQFIESWNYERGGEAPLQSMFEGTPEGRFWPDGNPLLFDNVSSGQSRRGTDGKLCYSEPARNLVDLRADAKNRGPSFHGMTRDAIAALAVLATGTRC